MEEPTISKGPASSRALAACLLLLLLGAVASAWYAALSASSQSEVADFARLRWSIPPTSSISWLANWWAGFCSVAWHMRVVGAATQVLAIFVTASVIRSRSRSTAIAILSGIALAFSPLSQYWLGRPLGILDGVAVLGFAAGLATFAGSGLRWRVGAVIGISVATACAGWPLLAAVAMLFVRRDRNSQWLLFAAFLGLGMRVLLRVPFTELVGSWSYLAPHALEGLRLLVKAAFALPALIYLATRPASREALRRAQRALQSDTAALVAACGILLITAPFLLDGATVVFCAQIVAIVGVAINMVGRRGPVLKAAAGCAIAMAVVCIALQVGHPAASDASQVRHDRSAIASAAANQSTITIIDHGDASQRERYPDYVIAYYAGHVVNVKYQMSNPPNPSGVVLDATPGGIVRVDESLRALTALETARQHLLYDFTAHSGLGHINRKTHEDTPSGLGVVPSLDLPGGQSSISTITVLSTYTYTFDGVPVSPGASLIYADTKALLAGYPMRATVSIEIAGRPKIVVNDTLEPGDPSGIRFWHFRSIPLGAAVSGTARVVFAASSPSGINLGDWASFGAPAIVRP